METGENSPFLAAMVPPSTYSIDGNYMVTVQDMRMKPV